MMPDHFQSIRVLHWGDIEPETKKIQECDFLVNKWITIQSIQIHTVRYWCLNDINGPPKRRKPQDRSWVMALGFPLNDREQVPNSQFKAPSLAMASESSLMFLLSNQTLIIVGTFWFGMGSISPGDSSFSPMHVLLRSLPCLGTWRANNSESSGAAHPLAIPGPPVGEMLQCISSLDGYRSSCKNQLVVIRKIWASG